MTTECAAGWAGVLSRSCGLAAPKPCDGGAGERDRLWLSRYAAFQVASGVPPEHAARARDKIAAELAVLTPQEDEAALREAGFRDVRLFYVGFAFRGWVACA
ncbi:hypothetical protein ACDW_29070 [Acidovorax sp. DW039]|uniref:hypothetical protein n=1 Tax=Acidovorax sp. DW039 TaxID=3095606 RepID=UPI00308F3A62|nr:hypothetical protein ACDW_29070 [Acidovorax sp. DW039]